MSIGLVVVLSIVLMGGMAFLTYLLGRRVSSRLVKYIPAFASLLGLVFFIIKLNFIPYQVHAFEGIFDMVAIIILAITFSCSLIVAIIVEFIQYKRRI
ncbi:hypothetical protein GMD78_05890 [Ornithinibacillus sp. L9]|uniref:Uncharacterized protein n=1 Tax=Ornithinibacillus caprae TaxID=2678566 RepID=A0A6N8FKW0_9BACI|nr:hypothetical protein [Ornithinibacillus caprae]MUK87928.1 hypothetical protein [Ornithinibacillus caprae]